MLSFVLVTLALPLDARAEEGQEQGLDSRPSSSGRGPSVIVDAAWQPDRVISSIDGHVPCVQFPRGGSLVSVSGDRLIQKFSTLTENRERVYEGATTEIIRFDFSPDERLVAGGSGDGNAFVWDVRATELAANLVEHRDQIMGVHFPPMVIGLLPPQPFTTAPSASGPRGTGTKSRPQNRRPKQTACTSHGPRFRRVLHHASTVVTCVSIFLKNPNCSCCCYGTTTTAK